MRVRIACKITNGLFTLLILNASLATNVPVSATSSTPPSKQQQTGNVPGDQESGQENAAKVDERPLSPRLAALWDRLNSGDREALDSFWREITERGAPMTEAAPGSERDVLVTILWRAREETRNVFVFRLGDVNKPMVRLLDTDLWYKTFQLQKGARFIYQLATNLPDPKEWRGITRFARDLRNDPFNPLQFAERYNEFNPYEVTFYSASNCLRPSRRCGTSSSLKFLLDECSATNSPANSSATNVQFGFTLRTATLQTRSLTVCWCLQTAVFT
jgi:hypothetical protein